MLETKNTGYKSRNIFETGKIFNISQALSCSGTATKILPPPVGDGVQKGRRRGSGAAFFGLGADGGYSTESTSVATYWLAPRQGRVPM